MWEGRQLLGTIFLRWRRKLVHCEFLFFPSIFFPPRIYLLMSLYLVPIEFRQGAFQHNEYFYFFQGYLANNHFIPLLGLLMRPIL